MKTEFNNRDGQQSTVAGWCWLAALLIALLCTWDARGNGSVDADHLQSFVCRVSNHHNGASDVGSGTLIDKTPDGREGLVLTCAHLFRDGVGEVVVRFADGKSHGAKLIDVDQRADLAALAIASPTGAPAAVAEVTSATSPVHACGYGPRGNYRCAVGTTVGQAASDGQMSLLINDPVRSGDSGGGVFDRDGRLVAVIWGEAQGVTYASFGKPLRRFLGRVLGRRTSVVYSCPDGFCPQRPTAPQPPRQATPIRGDARWGDLQRQLDELRESKQDRGDYLTRSELPNLGAFATKTDVQRIEGDSTARHSNILDRLQSISGRQVGKAAGTTAVGLLGLSGPAGWAIVAASSIGGWLIGRRMKRKLGGARGRRRRRFQR